MKFIEQVCDRRLEKAKCIVLFARSRHPKSLRSSQCDHNPQKPFALALSSVALYPSFPPLFFCLSQILLFPGYLFTGEFLRVTLLVSYRLTDFSATVDRLRSEPCKMAASTLVLSRFASLPDIPVDATFSSLAIDGSTLLDHLTDPLLSRRFRSACADIDTLTISFAGCGARLTVAALDKVLRFLNALRKLRRLEIRNFVRANPGAPSTRPACLGRSPPSIKKLTIARTHSSCLTFLLNCIEAFEVALESCLWIERLPECSRLELFDIQPFEELMEILLKWDGNDLTIDACPFLNEGFIYELLQRVTSTKKAPWPAAHICFDDYPYEVERRLHELLDVRSQL